MGVEMMVHFWVGVSGFSYASWKGIFYAEATGSQDMLEAYAQRLNSVEINSSFYHMPTQGTTTKWAALTPQGFRFSFKANRKITHFMKLKGAGVEFAFFLKGLNPMEKKMGCVLIQLPPYMKQDYETLETFLGEKPEWASVALEFRHISWFGDKLNKLLSKYNAALCVAETEDMKPVFERTAGFTYARLRHDRYSKGELKEWSQRLMKFAGDLEDCFVYFKHDETGDAANRAVDFSAMLAR
jgi:uncharacterized protein YecE (DUF72 family)